MFIKLNGQPLPSFLHANSGIVVGPHGANDLFLALGIIFLSSSLKYVTPPSMNLQKKHICISKHVSEQSKDIK